MQFTLANRMQVGLHDTLYGLLQHIGDTTFMVDHIERRSDGMFVCKKCGLQSTSFDAVVAHTVSAHLSPEIRDEFNTYGVALVGITQKLGNIVECLLCDTHNERECKEGAPLGDKPISFYNCVASVAVDKKLYLIRQDDEDEDGSVKASVHVGDTSFDIVVGVLAAELTEILMGVVSIHSDDTSLQTLEHNRKLMIERTAEQITKMQAGKVSITQAFQGCCVVVSVEVMDVNDKLLPTEAPFN